MADAKASRLARFGPAALAVALNLAPVAGVLVWGWSAFALIFLYWLENVVIGVRTAAGIVGAAALNRSSLAAATAVAGFFAVHYGIFCLVHGTFVVSMFGGASSGIDLPEAMALLFDRESSLVVGLFAIVVWQAVHLAMFLTSREARERPPFELMGAPYPRIVILHVTIIFGGLLLMMLNEPVAGLVLLALIKMAFDVAEALGAAPQDILRRSQSGHTPANQP
jgi:hypothetical protein